MSLVETIHDPDSTQGSVAAAYAQAIRDEGDALHHGEQWARANTAIVERWDELALQRIKTEAWALVEARKSGASYACPVCGRESFNATDVQERWCGNCHGLTSDEPPEGFAWVQFVDGDSVLFGRMLQRGYIELGATYDVVLDDGATFTYDGERFVKR